MKRSSVSQLKSVRIVHCVFFGLVMSVSLLVDGNGCVLSLGAFASTLLGLFVFGVGSAAAIALIVKERGGWRAFGIASLILYGMLLLPAIWI